MMNYTEIVKLSTKGDKQATEDLFRLGDEYASAGHFEESAKAFKDAAISYRISAFRNEAQLEDFEDKVEILTEDIEFYKEWITIFKSGHPAIPKVVEGVDCDAIYSGLLGVGPFSRWPTDPEIRSTYCFLYSMLDKNNEEWETINPKRIGFIYELMLSYFGFNGLIPELLRVSTDVRIGLDLLAHKIEVYHRVKSK